MSKGRELRKTSRDNRDSFAVFKKGSFMEGASFWEKFKYWFKNIYLPHYALATVIAILILVFAVTLVSDIINNEKNDLDYILGGAIFADTEQMQELSAYMAGILSENGEEVKIGDQMLCTQNIYGATDMTEAIDEYNAASIEKIYITMADDEVLLFFFDREYAKFYEKEGAFLLLSEVGIEGDESEYFVRVDETPIFKKTGIKHNGGIYAAIKMKNQSRSENERILKKYENAARVLAGILSEKA